MPCVRTRAAVLGLLLLAGVGLSASPGAARTTPKRPLEFAVGTTTLHFDNQGRSLATTVYYPATGRASTLAIDGAPARPNGVRSR